MTIREIKKETVKNPKEVFRFEREDGFKIVVYENMQAIFLSDEENGDFFHSSPEHVLKKYLLNSPIPSSH